MIILGVDGSTTSTGVAVVDSGESMIMIMERKLFVPPRATFTKQGTMKKSAYKALHAMERKEAAKERVLFMMENIRGVLDRYEPGKIVVEDSYGQNDIMTTKMLSRIHGYIIGWALEHDIPCIMKPPSRWRKEMGIPLMGEDKKPLKRDELKRLAKEKVRELFDIEVDDDEADAILIALSEVREL